MTQNNSSTVYASINDQLRRVIISMKNSGHSVKNIISVTGIKKSTIYDILKIYASEKRASKKPRGGNRRPYLTSEEKQAIMDKVSAEPAITLKNLQTFVRECFQKSIGTSTIDRLLKDFAFSFKQTTIVPERRNNESTIEKRRDFANEFFNRQLEVNDANFVFIDEVGFNISMRVKKARSLKGTPAILTVPNIRTRNISVIAAVNKYGTLDFHINNNPVNGTDFENYILNLREKCIEMGIPEPIFILDNARIHHYSGVKEACLSNNIIMCYLPPYSPQLNIIENCFSKWKNFVRRKEPKNEEELNDYIMEGFNVITSEDLDGFFRKFLRTIDLCRRNIPLFD